MAELLDSSDNEEGFKINESYADNYNKWREKEEFQKLKDKYGDAKSAALESDSSSSSESEDEINDFTPDVEEKFLKTLSLLKSNDPIIYDKNISFFKENEISVKKPVRNKKKQPMFIKDYERELLLKEDEELCESEEPHTHTYVEEQKTLKESFKTAFDDSDDDNLLTVRKKTKEEENAEESEFLSWLKGDKEHLSKNKGKEKDFKYLHDYWNNEKLDSSEVYLKDYILNKRYLEKDTDESIPTYDEIIGDQVELSDDEKLLEKQEMFEHKFNFRFEEPDPDFIKRYPRTMIDTMRKKDARRKKKRDEYKDRKNHEKEQKREELKRLKAFKRKEIMEKLEKLQEITGTDKIGFDDDDIEGDFDPEQYDKKMKQLFNDDYYAVGEDDKKPEFPYDEELESEDWDNWVREEDSDEARSKSKSNYANDISIIEDTSFNMECEKSQEDSLQHEMVHASKHSKRKRKSKFSEILAKNKPIFNPTQHSFEQYLDEYYKLDYEDIIGDLPVRFSYREVQPNNFGLSTEEILRAKDKELNSWCTLKKTFQFRSKDEENYDVQAFRKKAENENLKKRILSSLFEEVQSETNPESSTNKAKKKRKKKKIAQISNDSLNNTENSLNVKNKTISLPESSIPSQEYTNSRESSEILLSTKKNKKKCKRKRKELSLCANQDAISNFKEESGSPSKKKKKFESNYVPPPSKETISNNKQQNFETTKLENQNFSSKKHKKIFKHSSFKEPCNYKVPSNQSDKKDKQLVMSNERLKAYGINPKKFKNKLMYGKNNKM